MKLFIISLWFPLLGNNIVDFYQLSRQASIQLFKSQHGSRQICADPFFECACFMFVFYKYVLKNDIVNNQ